jgi:hypothetical protein
MVVVMGNGDSQSAVMTGDDAWIIRKMPFCARLLKTAVRRHEIGPERHSRIPGENSPCHHESLVGAKGIYRQARRTENLTRNLSPASS